MATITQKIREYDTAMDHWLSATPLRRFIHWFIFWPLMLGLGVWSVSGMLELHQRQQYVARIAEAEAATKQLRTLAAATQKYLDDWYMMLMPGTTRPIALEKLSAYGLPAGFEATTGRGTQLRACYWRDKQWVPHGLVFEDGLPADPANNSAFVVDMSETMGNRFGDRQSILEARATSFQGVPIPESCTPRRDYSRPALLLSRTGGK
jgi:hypothetical protein